MLKSKKIILCKTKILGLVKALYELVTPLQLMEWQQ